MRYVDGPVLLGRAEVIEPDTGLSMYMTTPGGLL
jgi:hypothetical protein